MSDEKGKWTLPPFVAFTFGFVSLCAYFVTYQLGRIASALEVLAGIK